jgi:hypothetical protein
VPDDDKQPDETRPAAPPEGSEIGEEKDEAADAEQGDKFRPEAIAERVGNIGEETELDRVAREEEAKLTARKKAAKKEKKSALESAASKRLARIGEGKVKRPSAPGVRAGSAAMDGDPLLDRTVRLSEWIQKNQQTFGAVVGVALLGGLGLFGYSYWQNKRNADASALLAAAMADEHGAVAPSKDDDDEETKPAALYPTFATAAERRDAALAAYRKVESRYAGTGAAILARLSEAGLLLDKGDAQGALAAYEDVKASPLAMADAQVRGRALEGMGFAYELLAQTDAAGKDKHLDDALGVYRQLEQFDLKGMKELGMFHEARVLQAKGDKAKAIEVLKDLQKRVSEPGESHPFPYLQAVAEEKLRDLDPSALPPKAPPSSMMGGGGMGGPGGPDMSDPRVQEMWRQIQERMRQQGGGGEPIPVPGGPPPP